MLAAGAGAAVFEESEPDEVLESELVVLVESEPEEEEEAPEDDFCLSRLSLR